MIFQDSMVFFYAVLFLHIDKLRFDAYNVFELKGGTLLTEKEKNARIFKAFCDPNRLTILELLQSGEKCACKLLEELQIGQSTLSHHMKILCDAEIVTGRKDGKWTYYSFNTEGVEAAKKLLEKITHVNNNETQECCK